MINKAAVDCILIDISLDLCTNKQINKITKSVPNKMDDGSILHNLLNCSIDLVKGKQRQHTIDQLCCVST